MNEGLGKESFPRPPVGGVMLAARWSWKQAGGECPSPSVGCLQGNWQKCMVGRVYSLDLLTN